MIKFIRKILNSEFLPVSEVRRLKVYVVMFFLFLITLVTVPLSFFLDYSSLMKIISLVLFALFYFLSILLVRFNKIFTAIQLTIIYSIALTLFYAQGISSFYAYVFFYITLTIIIFYQELYSYFIYGTITLILGVFYTLSNTAGLVVLNDVSGSVYIYIAGLVIYYLVSFIQIINNEKLYADMNLEWVHLNQLNSNYQEDILYYLEDIRADLQKSPLYEDLEFQKAAFELSDFIAQQILKDGKEIVNLIDLYVYIHEKGLDSILNNNEISTAMKKSANVLGKYLINENSDMFSMIISFYLSFKNTKDYDINRYNYSLNSFVEANDEQFIAFVLIYLYLYQEVIGVSKWQKLSSDEELNDVFDRIDMHEFFSNELIAFYHDNQELFKKYTKKN